MARNPATGPSVPGSRSRYPHPRGAGRYRRDRQFNGHLGTQFVSPINGAVGALTAPLIGALVGVVLGLIAVRTRRLELASALHAGVDKPSLVIQTTWEAVVWAGLPVLALTPASYVLAGHGNSDNVMAASLSGLATVAATGAGAILGTMAATAATRERHLFRYFRTR